MLIVFEGHLSQIFNNEYVFNSGKIYLHFLKRNIFAFLVWAASDVNHTSETASCWGRRVAEMSKAPGTLTT